MHISDNLRDQIKQENDIVEIVSSYVSLTKDGTLYKAVCPFHQEKTSSFKVYPETQSYYCYGCGSANSNKTSDGSDVISFVMNIEKISFTEACRKLAEKVGILLAESEDEQLIRAEKESVTKRNRRYFKALKENPEALQYLYSRGITDETIAQYRLGYVSGEDGQDKNRNRISFAIMEVCSKPEKAHTISMAYRTLTNEDPKYRNDYNSRIYKKSNSLYLLSHATKAIREKGYAVVVEGYMDALRLHQEKVENTVAIMGCSFTTEQMSLLRKYTDTVYLWLDNDEAGKNARNTALPELLKLGFTVYFVESDKDPDETVVSLSKEKIESFILNFSCSAVQIMINQLCSEYDALVSKARSDVLRKTLPLIDCVENTIDRTLYQNMLGNRLQLNISDKK